MNKKSNILVILTFVMVIMLGLFIRTYVFSIRIIEGSSMSPLLKENDLLFVNMLSKHYSAGDIVIFNPYPNSNFILVKRIIAGPNSSFYINDYKVVINDTPLNTQVLNIEDHKLLTTTESPTPTLTYKTQWKLSSLYCRYSEIQKTNIDEYIVLGDNRCSSSDSRVFGAVHAKNIVGKVIYTLPLGSLFRSKEKH